MKHLRTVRLALIATLAMLLGFGMAQDASTEMTDEEKIADAMSAGPAAIAQDATIAEWPTELGGEFNVLREGSNGWTCLVSSSAAILGGLQDASCEDEIWFAWDKAFVAGEEPNVEKVGISYMLSGDAGLSNTDPSATAPTDDNEWHVSSPHTMVLVPGSNYEGVSTDHTNGGPYVMWAGTPYAHIMVPVGPYAGE